MCVSAISTPALVIFGQELCLLFDHYHHHLLLLQKRLLAELGDTDYLGVVDLGGGQLASYKTSLTIVQPLYVHCLIKVTSWTPWAGAFTDHCKAAARYLRQKVLHSLVAVGSGMVATCQRVALRDIFYPHLFRDTLLTKMSASLQDQSCHAMPP